MEKFTNVLLHRWFNTALHYMNCMGMHVTNDIEFSLANHSILNTNRRVKHFCHWITSVDFL